MKRYNSKNLTEIQYICKLDFGKVLWNGLCMYTFKKENTYFANIYKDFTDYFCVQKFNECKGERTKITKIAQLRKKNFFSQGGKKRDRLYLGNSEENKLVKGNFNILKNSFFNEYPYKTVETILLTCSLVSVFNQDKVLKC